MMELLGASIQFKNEFRDVLHFQSLPQLVAQKRRRTFQTLLRQFGIPMALKIDASLSQIAGYCHFGNSAALNFRILDFRYQSPRDFVPNERTHSLGPKRLFLHMTGAEKLTSKSSSTLLLQEGFELIAWSNIRKILETNTALVTGSDFLHVVFETTETRNLAFVNHAAITQ